MKFTELDATHTRESISAWCTACVRRNTALHKHTGLYYALTGRRSAVDRITVYIDRRAGGFNRGDERGEVTSVLIYYTRVEWSL